MNSESTIEIAKVGTPFGEFEGLLGVELDF